VNLEMNLAKFVKNQFLSVQRPPYIHLSYSTLSYSQLKMKASEGLQTAAQPTIIRLFVINSLAVESAISLTNTLFTVAHGDVIMRFRNNKILANAIKSTTTPITSAVFPSRNTLLTSICFSCSLNHECQYKRVR
jgi:hypothetical protein